jgi:hypothetical protein
MLLFLPLLLLLLLLLLLERWGRQCRLEVLTCI